MLKIASALAFVAVAHANHDIERQVMIDEINSMSNATWTAGVNERFRGTPIDSHKSLCGVKKGSEASLKANAEIHTSEMWGAEADDIPDEFDSATNWPKCAKVINEIRDQSNCGCCWAFGGAEAASDRMCIATDGEIMVPLSAQETCFCSNPDGCDGGFVETPWDWIRDNGLTTGGMHNDTGALGGGFCSSYSLPHCHHHGPQGKDPYPAEGQPGCPSEASPMCPTKCDADAEAPHNDFKADRYTFKGTTTSYADVLSIQRAVMGQGPVECAFTVYADFANYVSGVYHHVTGDVLGGHAVRIVGWGVDAGTPYWKIANSWNPYWGEEGYFRILRGKDECGIESQVAANSATATWGLKA